VDLGSKSTRIVEGRMDDGKIEWLPMVVNRGELGDPHWGTIKDGRMDLSYGTNRNAKGTVTLQFAKKKGPGGR
jgi:hypothetical protein